MSNIALDKWITRQIIVSLFHKTYVMVTLWLLHKTYAVVTLRDASNVYPQRNWISTRQNLQ